MLRSFATLSLAVIAVMAAGPARAGFEWVPPKETAPAPQVQQAPAPQPQDNWAAAPVPVTPAYGQMAYNPVAYPGYQAAPSYPPMQENGYYAGANNFPNPVPPAPAPSASAGGLVINPYPMAPAGYAQSMMNTGSIEGAMLSESRTLNPLQLGNGMNTGGKMRPMAPSVPAAAPIAPQQQQAFYAPPMGNPGGLSPMPGGTPAPLAMYGADGQPISGAYAAPQVIQAPIAPPPPAVAAAPLSPPPGVMDRRAADTQYPQGAPTSMLKSPSAPARAMPASVPPQQQSNLPEAVGFGNDLPLALALSQVIPGDYALFFESAIDSEANVSWQGGKSWDLVLQDMLAPLGLRAVIQPNLVLIRSA